MVQTPYAERRSSPRTRKHEEAEVLLGAGQSVQALIVDESGDGFRLAFQSAFSLPPRFHMLRKTDSLRVFVQLVWQRGTLAGLRLIRS